MKYGTMKKTKSWAFGKNVYLLGKDVGGIYYWLEEPSWDCDWYWGFGYIETYTNNKYPNKSKDINSHQHANDFIKWAIEINGEKPILAETTFSEKEAWKLTELFKRFYLFQELAEFYHRGGTGIAALKDDKNLKNEEKEKEINQKILPEIMDKIIEILEP